MKDDNPLKKRNSKRSEGFTGSTVWGDLSAYQKRSAAARWLRASGWTQLGTVSNAGFTHPAHPDELFTLGGAKRTQMETSGSTVEAWIAAGEPDIVEPELVLVPTPRQSVEELRELGWTGPDPAELWTHLDYPWVGFSVEEARDLESMGRPELEDGRWIPTADAEVTPAPWRSLEEVVDDTLEAAGMPARSVSEVVVGAKGVDANPMPPKPRVATPQSRVNAGPVEMPWVEVGQTAGGGKVWVRPAMPPWDDGDFYVPPEPEQELEATEPVVDSVVASGTVPWDDEED